MSRTSPQIAGETIFVGTQLHALVVALSRTTGQTLAVIQINPHPYAVITQSPTFFDGKLFIGTSSFEHYYAPDASYPCCSLSANFVALEFSPSTSTSTSTSNPSPHSYPRHNPPKPRFRVLQNITTIPLSQRQAGWAGASIWGSQPSFSSRRRLAFIGTGNTYSTSASTRACQLANDLTAYILNGPDPCLPQDVLQDSVLAIDIDTGKVGWTHQSTGVDAYKGACGYPGLGPRNSALCPQVPGPDADFGMAPAYVPSSTSTQHGHGDDDMVVLGRKNGVIHALSAVTGQNGMVYFAVINTEFLSWQLKPSNITVDRGAYGALDVKNGRIIWPTAVP
ncbi:quinon protein alcohol dehydrogenase-like superfamily [Bombardia bombarda]|uniref:Quinon protein alcohol dehydrogenase-like superfamily n=1 Tax=Bombardia bombarda TaxID=252184 RepID=A0AA39WH20_9PEZI|nr:quinon protein alcohol dehydrogenase-like superfamily [Bombardia bombarda]